MPYTAWGDTLKGRDILRPFTSIIDELIFEDGAIAHSAGFEPGTQGWIIRSDGTAEFNGDVSIGGDLSVTGTMDVTGNVTFNGQIVTFTDNSFSGFVYDMGADNNGYITAYAGPYAISITVPRDNTGDATDAVDIYLQQSSASDDAYWSIRAGPAATPTMITGDSADSSLLINLGGELWDWKQNYISRAAATQPHIILDSVGTGDNWTSQGAYIKIGENANTEAGTAALSMSYVGDGAGYLGMGGMTSGVPAYGLKLFYNKEGIYAIGNGSISNPSFSWANDTDMGIYKIANGRFGFTAAGTKVGEFGGYSGTSSDYFNIRWGDGSETRPTYSFFNDIDSGMWSFGTNEVAIGAGGATKLLIGSYGIKIDTSDDILPRTDNSSQLGASGARYIDVWAVDTTINSSDERIKHDLRGLPLDAMQFVKDTTPVSFVREGGKREHYGWTAQQIKAAMDAQGVDWGAYVDPAIGGVPDGKRKEDGFGHGPLALRQAELVPVLWQAVQELEQRVATLEAAR